jgi:hypothetical protein
MEKEISFDNLIEIFSAYFDINVLMDFQNGYLNILRNNS